MELEISDQVERAFEALLEDVERIGPLSRAHAINVASRRGLSADETAALLVLLQQGDALEDSLRADADVAVGPDSGGAPSPEDPRFGGVTLHEMPGKLLDHRVLRHEQEVALGRRIQMGLQAKEAINRGATSAELVSLAADGDAARQVMIRNNIRLARDIAKSFIPQRGELEFEDLVQEGVRGLNRAAEKFNPDLGYKFSTYATWWIKQSISRAIDDTSTTVRLPVHVRESFRQIHRYASNFETRNSRPPNLQEIAEGVGKDPGTVQAIIDFVSPLVRLDAPISDEEGGDTLGSVLLPSAPPVEDEVVDRMMLREIEQRLEMLAAGFDPRVLRIMEGRFGLHGHEQMTLDALGREFGITRERIRQIEKKVRGMIDADPFFAGLRRDYREDIDGAA